jgi:hypothetical protein
MGSLIKGQELRLKKDTSTGDWKTSLVRPDDFPLMKKGDTVIFERKMENLYGTWYGVFHKSSKYIQDIRESDFEIKE